MAKTASRIAARTTLKFGLVESPIALYKGSGDDKRAASFQTAGPNGKPLERAPLQGGKRHVEGVAVPQGPRPTVDTADAPIEAAPIVDERVEENPIYTGLVEEGHDGEVLPEQVRKGVFLEDGTFVDVTDELAAVKEATQLEVMEIVGFVEAKAVPLKRVVGSYYVGSDGEGSPTVLRLLLEAMRATKRVALVKWTKSARQALGVITAGASGELFILQLEWAANVRDVDKKALTHLQAVVTKDEVAAAVELATTMAVTPEAIATADDDAARMLGELRELALTDDTGRFDRPVVATLPADAVTLADQLKASADQRTAVTA